MQQCTALRFLQMDGWWHSETCVEQLSPAFQGKPIRKLKIGAANRITSRKQELLRSLLSLRELILSIEQSSPADIAHVLATCPMVDTLVVRCQVCCLFFRIWEVSAC